MVNDAHCHFFSRPFFSALAAQKWQEESAERATEHLGWETPGPAEELADRWVAELDRHEVSRAALMASIPGDEDSVVAAVRRHPERFVGFFMVNPMQPDAAERLTKAVAEGGLRCACFFPAMHHYRMADEQPCRLLEILAEGEGTAAFVHCGALSVGVRKKLGLESRFDLTVSSPLEVHPVALRFPGLKFIIPHFGAGLFREALMVADLCPNVFLDTSSSNNWVKYQPGLTLNDVFHRAIDVVGPGRLLFGTDSSFFPRGWQKSVFQEQKKILQELSLEPEAQQQILGQNFDGLFRHG